MFVYCKLTKADTDCILSCIAYVHKSGVINVTKQLNEVVKHVQGQEMKSVHIRLPASIIAQIDDAIAKAATEGTKITRSDVCRAGVIFFWNDRLQNVDASV